MKKVLFLMFLLFLIGLGTANVNAQVRIGGNAAPNGAAVLDLNATDAATGTKGLALPRVRLDSATMQITPGVANLTGLLVYNTTATLGAGIYFWSGSAWVKANLPITSAIDSGKFLQSNGTTWVAAIPGIATSDTVAHLWLRAAPTPVTWSIILDTTILIPFMTARTAYILQVPGITQKDMCMYVYGNNYLNVANAFPNAVPSFLLVYTWSGYSRAAQYSQIRCYRPSV